MPRTKTPVISPEGVKLSNQEQRCLEYMKKHKGITQKESTEVLGDTRLASTIERLRKKGYAIDTLRMDTVNRFGEETWYGKYVFSKTK